jgi:membrane complex biogenesis BtpA family protein
MTARPAVHPANPASLPRLVAMIHVGATPGSPAAREDVPAIAARAADEARALEDAGFDAVMIENMHDVPYLARTVGPEVVAAMTAAAIRVREATSLPVGVQVLAGANHAALAVARAADLQFIRAEGFAFAAVADEGLLAEADAGPLLRYRRAIDATGIAILADVRKKHSSHAITADLDLAECVHGAIFAGADGLIVTGTATGSPTDPDDLHAAVRAAGTTPVWVGSGATAATAAGLLDAGAHGIIVGTTIKRDGDWRAPVDPARAAAFVRAAGGD